MSLFNRLFTWIGTFGQAKDETVNGQGAFNTCWAATCERKGIVNGEMYFPVGIVGPKVRENTNAKLAGDLYEWTQKELEKWI
jgi:hypothetical protein